MESSGFDEEDENSEYDSSSHQLQQLENLPEILFKKIREDQNEINDAMNLFMGTSYSYDQFITEAKEEPIKEAVPRRLTQNNSDENKMIMHLLDSNSINGIQKQMLSKIEPNIHRSLINVNDESSLHF